MSFKDIAGNEKVIGRMMQALKSGNISHAYILEGDSRVDKLALANDFVKAILCEQKNGDCCDTCISCTKINHGNHEDVIYLTLEGNSIKDEAVEELQSRIKKKPYVGDRNIVVIEDADTMTLRAQNRLLKTLEEPTSGTVIILLSENTENLVQTILSRCVIYKLNPYHTRDMQDALKNAIAIADMLLDKKPFYAISAKLSEFTSNKEQALEFLDILEGWYRDLAVCAYDTPGELICYSDRLEELIRKNRKYSAKGVDKAVESIEEAKNNIVRNMNISYSIKNMILKIIA